MRRATHSQLVAEAAADSYGAAWKRDAADAAIGENFVAAPGGGFTSGAANLARPEVGWSVRPSMVDSTSK